MIKKPQLLLRQDGIILIIGLFFLVLMTIIGMNVMDTGVMEERMAGNSYDRSRAFQASESALREAEQWLAATFCARPDPTVTADIWPQNEPADPVSGEPLDPHSDAWWAAATVSGSGLGNITTQPRYTIEEIEYDAEDDYSIYRITARAAGGTTEAMSIAQSTYRQVFDNILVIEGTPGVDFVAIAENAVYADVSLSSTVDMKLSLGGTAINAACTSGSQDIVLYFDGQGATDTFTVANLADLDYDANPAIQALSLPAPLSNLTNFTFRKILVENSGSTAVTITNTNLGAQQAQDNYYCINNETLDGPGVMETLLGDFFPALFGNPALSSLQPIANILNAALLSPAIGQNGLIPALPVLSSAIVDIGGDDTYEIHTGANSNAIVLIDFLDNPDPADPADGDDVYIIETAGSFINAPVIIDIDDGQYPPDSFNLSGADYVVIDQTIPAFLASNLQSALTGLNALSGMPVVGPVVTDLLTNASETALATILAVSCPASNPFCPAQVALAIIFSEINTLFGGTTLSGGSGTAYESGVCTPLFNGRISWREIY